MARGSWMFSTNNFLPDHRCEAAVEADHQVTLAAVVGLNDFGQFVFLEAKRFFAEDVLTSLERRHDLRRVQVMTGGDHNSVHSRIIDDLSFVRSAISKAEFLACVPRVSAARGTYSNEVQPTNFLHCWQQRVHRESTRPQHTKTNWLVGSHINALLPGNHFEPRVLLRRVRIRDQHAKKRAVRDAANNFVRI